MRDFIAIDFETGNPKRVSACALGFARVVEGQVVESHGLLIKPVGGHAPFQSKIHGITEEHTFDKPDFGQIFPQIRHLFGQTLVAHSLFDQQVLSALSEHFGLALDFEYVDTSALAMRKLPHLKNHKLKTLAKHFHLPKFQHHNAKEDAIACAAICLRFHEVHSTLQPVEPSSEVHELRGMIAGVLADDEINYKEVYELLYWLDDHPLASSYFPMLRRTAKKALSDENLESFEADDLKHLLRVARDELATIVSVDGKG